MRGVDVRLWPLLVTAHLLAGCSGGSGSTGAIAAPEANHAPVAVTDIVVANGGPLVIDVLSNDYDPDGEPLRIVEVSEPGHGTASVSDAGTPADTSDDHVVYTPAADYRGADEFSYTVSDGGSGRGTGSVVITAATSGTASDKYASTPAGTPVSVSVIDSVDTAIASLSPPAFGSVAIDANGTPSNANDDFVVYTPMAGYVGPDTFFFTLTGDAGTGTAAVNVQVTDLPTPLALPNVRGQVAKGLLRNARIEVFRIGPGGNPVGLPIAATTTDSQGRWALALPDPRPTLLVTTRGGSYEDESRSDPRRVIELDDNSRLLTVLRPDDAFIVSSIYTTSLYLRARHRAGGSGFASAYDAVLADSVAAWGLNLATTPTADPVNPNPALAQDRRLHAMALGGAANVLDRVVLSLALTEPDARTIDAVARDLADCALDGRDFDGPIRIQVRGVSTAIADTLDLNLEILRFRNNNFSLYAATPLAVRNAAACRVVTPPPDLQPPLVSAGMHRTNSPSPALSGFVDDPGASISVTVNATSYSANNLGSHWHLPAGLISPDLADGTYDVAVRATDRAGNIGTDATVAELVIDSAAPTITIDSVIGPDSSPALSGTIDDPAGAVSIRIAGNDYSASVSGLTWSLPAGSIAPALEPGIHPVTVTAVDGFANTAVLTSPAAVTVSANTPPSFAISGDLVLAENFVGARVVTITPDAVPPADSDQTVTYSLTPATSDFATLSIDPVTGTVFVTAVADRSGSQAFTILADDGQDTANFAARTFTLTVSAVNNPPVFELSGDILENQDFAGTRAVSVTPFPVPADETTQVVTYSLSPASVPFANVTFDASSGAVGITSVPGATGSQVFTITADDGEPVNNTATGNFTLTVSGIVAGNVTPVITGQLPLDTPEEVPLALTLAELLVTDPDNSYPGDFTLSVQPGANYTVVGNTIRPIADFSGVLTVPVTVYDGASSSALFDVAVAVTPVNDAPNFTVSGHIAETEDFGGSRVINVLAAPVPADETGQSVTYSLSPLSVGFANVVLDASTGTVTVTAVADEHGSQVFTLTADDGQTVNNTVSRAFVVTVSSVNDAPVFSLSGDISETEDFVGARVVTVTPGPVPANESSEAVSYSLTPASVAFADIAFDSSSGAVTINSVAQGFGSQSFTITADDGQPSNNTASQGFSLTVAADNDAPTTSDIGDISVIEDSAPVVVDLFGAFDDIEDADTDLVFTVIANSNPALFDSLPIDPVAGTLTVDFAADTSGVSALTVRATDTGGATVDAAFIVTVNALADLSLALTPSDPAPGIGLEVDFTVQLDHSGPSVATGVVVSVPLPAGYTYVDDDSSGRYNPATGQWSLAAVSATTTLVLTVEANAAGPYLVTAEVAAVNESDPDSVPGNGDASEDDQASATTSPVPVADLSLAVSVDDPIPAPGATVVLTVTATNFGQFGASNIHIELPPLAGQLSYESASPSAGAFNLATGDWTGVSVGWSGDPAAPFSATLDVTARVDASVATTTVLESTATLVSFDQVDPDPVETDSVAILILADGIQHEWVGGAGPDPNDWHNAANWDTGLVPSPGDEVTIPPTGFNPVLNADALTLATLLVESGAQLNLNGYTLSTVGSLNAKDGPVTGPGLVRLEFGTIRGTVPDLEVVLATASAEAEFKGDTVINGNFTLSQGRMDVNDETITVNGDLLSTGTGLLLQKTGGGEVIVSGNASFVGADYTQLVGGKFPLRSGVLFVGGDFSQSGHPHSFAAENNHLVVLNGSGPQTVYFQDPDNSSPDPDEPALSGSRFANLQFDKDSEVAGAVTLLSDVVVLRQLEQPLGGVPRLMAAPGSGHVLQIGGADVDTAPFPQTENIIFDNVPVHVFQSADLNHLEGLVFTNMDPAVPQLSIERRAFGGSTDLLDLRFETLPDFTAGGRYILLNNTHPDPSKNLTIDVLESAPAYGVPMTETVGNAAILWGSGAEDTDRDGIADADEYTFGTNPVFADSDGDGSSDPDELSGGTDPNLADTDGDGISDGAEILAGGDPLAAAAPGTILYVRPPPLGDDANSGFGGWGDALATNAAVEAALLDGAGPTQPFYVLYDAGVYGPLLIDSHADISVIGSVGPGVIIPVQPATTIFDASSVPDVAVVSLIDSASIALQSLWLTGADNDGDKLGGGMFVNDSSTGTITNILIEDNVASDAGGGIYIDAGGALTVEQSVIRRNMVPDGGDAGGGIAAYGTLTMVESVVADNRYDGNVSGGGGLYLELASGPAILRDNLITANFSRSFGGGIAVFDASFPLTVFNNLILGNTNDEDLGGGIFGDKLDRGAAVLIESNTVAFNRSLGDDKSAGGLHLDRADDVQLRDNVGWYNVDADTVDELQDQFVEDSGGALFEFNSFEDFGAPDLDFNNGDNPRFERGFYLRSDSSVDDEGSRTADAAGLAAPYTTRTDGAADTGFLDRGFHYRDIADGQPYAVTVVGEIADCGTNTLTLQFVIEAVGGPLGPGHVVAARRDGDDTAGGTLVTRTGIQPYGWSNSQLVIDEGDGVYRFDIVGVSHASGEVAVYELEIDDATVVQLNSSNLTTVFGAAGC